MPDRGRLHPYRRRSRAVARPIVTLNLAKPRWIRIDRTDRDFARADVSHVIWFFLSNTVGNDPLDFSWCEPMDRDRVGERGARNSVSAMPIVPRRGCARCMLRNLVNRGAGRLSLQDAIVVQSRSWSSCTIKYECDRSTKASSTMVMQILIQDAEAY